VADNPKASVGRIASGSGKAKTSMGGHQTKATKLFESSKSSSGPSGFGKKLETKALKGAEDDEYLSEEESDDKRKGGRRILPLLKKVSKPCHRKGETKKIVHCIASKGKSQVISQQLLSNN